MKCKDCLYYWKEDGDLYNHCYFTPKCPGHLPPCECDNYEDDEEITYDENLYEEEDYE